MVIYFYFMEIKAFCLFSISFSRVGIYDPAANPHAEQREA